MTDVTWPPTPKAAEASLTGSTLPTTVRVVPMSARVTVVVRYPVLLPLTSAQAAAPPPRTSSATSPPTRTARRWPARPQPARPVLGTATSAEEAATTAGAAEAAGAAPPSGGGDAHRRGRHRAVGGRRPEGTDTVTDSQVGRAALWVALTVVEPDVVTVSVWVLGVAGFLVFDVELVWPGRPKEPPESEIPEMVSVEPVTAVTLPEAMSRFAKALRKLLAPEPEGKDGRVPPSPPPPRKANPPPPPAPPKPLGGVPLPALPLNRAPPPVQVPVELGVVTVRLRGSDRRLRLL